MKHIFALLGILLFIFGNGQTKKKSAISKSSNVIYQVESTRDYQSGAYIYYIKNRHDVTKPDKNFPFTMDFVISGALKTQKTAIREHKLDPISEHNIRHVLRYKGLTDTERPKIKYRIIAVVKTKSGSISEVRLMSVATGKDFMYTEDGVMDYNQHINGRGKYLKGFSYDPITALNTFGKYAVGSEVWIESIKINDIWGPYYKGIENFEDPSEQEK